MSEKLLRIFIGYDKAESVAWHTLVSSIYRQSSIPVAFIPIHNQNLASIFQRNLDENQSNSFSFSRFLVPYLCDYSGWGIYMDCDMLLRCDIADILQVLENPDAQSNAVYVVKHDYTPKNDTKYLGNIQHAYPRKNWSSFIVWNCSHEKNKIVDTEFVNTASPQNLHRFGWLNDDEIGSLGVEWNWLVGEYSQNSSAPRNIHWTIGGPYFNEYSDTDFADEWRREFKYLSHCDQISD